MKKVVKKYNQIVALVNDLAQYIESINRVPPQGEKARELCCIEVSAVCETISDKVKDCKTLLLEKICCRGGKND